MNVNYLSKRSSQAQCGLFKLIIGLRYSNSWPASIIPCIGRIGEHYRDYEYIWTVENENENLKRNLLILFLPMFLDIETMRESYSAMAIVNTSKKTG